MKYWTTQDTKVCMGCSQLFYLQELHFFSPVGNNQMFSLLSMSPAWSTNDKLHGLFMLTLLRMEPSDSETWSWGTQKITPSRWKDGARSFKNTALGWRYSVAQGLPHRWEVLGSVPSTDKTSTKPTTSTKKPASWHSGQIYRTRLQETGLVCLFFGAGD